MFYYYLLSSLSYNIIENLKDLSSANKLSYDFVSVLKQLEERGRHRRKYIHTSYHRISPRRSFLSLKRTPDRVLYHRKNIVLSS
jgi:hypothetical protein